MILGYDLKLPASIINNLLFDVQKQLENSKYGTKLEIKPIFKNFSQITLVLCPNQNDFLKKDCEGDKIYYSDFSSILSISAPGKQEWLAKTLFTDGAYIAIDAISGQTRAVPMAFYSEITSAFDFMHNQAIQRIPKIETMKFNEPTRLFKKIIRQTVLRDYKTINTPLQVTQGTEAINYDSHEYNSFFNTAFEIFRNLNAPLCFYYPHKTSRDKCELILTVFSPNHIKNLLHLEYWGGLEDIWTWDSEMHGAFCLNFGRWIYKGGGEPPLV